MENQIKIKAFGMVAEKLGSQELTLSNPGNSESLTKQILEEFPSLRSVKFSLAVNKKLCSERAEIPVGAEVAILPPFSGG